MATFIEKIAVGIEVATGLRVYYDSPETLNVKADSAPMPCVLIPTITNSGLADVNGEKRERYTLSVMFCNTTELDFDGRDNEAILYELSLIARKWLVYLERNIYARKVGDVSVERLYATEDAILTAYVLNITLEEVYGVGGCCCVPTDPYEELVTKYVALKDKYNELYELYQECIKMGQCCDELTARMNEVEQSIESLRGELANGIVHNTTYEELKDLRYHGSLIKGHYYRITDYVTTTAKANTQSAMHPFDVIVLAISNNELSEDAKASRHEGDEYFANVDLNAWELKYCLDNDETRFDWADIRNGKGVIYYMKDERNNILPYDMKNIQKLYNDVYVYTFGGEVDETIKEGAFCCNNIIDPYVKNDVYVLEPNIFGIDCRNNILLCNCRGNVFGKYSYHNFLKDNFYNNICGDYFNENFFTNECYANTFGSHCVANRGFYFYENKVESYCNHNIYTGQKNTISYACYNNTIEGSNNIIGNDVFNSVISGSNNNIPAFCKNILIRADYVKLKSNLVQSLFLQNVKVKNSVSGSSDNVRLLDCDAAGHARVERNATTGFLTFGSSLDTEVNV